MKTAVLSGVARTVLGKSRFKGYNEHVYNTRPQGRGSGKPTRNDVARHANISGATVSRVLSGRTDVPISPETRAKVLEAARELGYQPNAAARALLTGRSGLIGFWMSLHYSRYRGQVLDCMRKLLGSGDMALAVMDVDEDYHWTHSFSRALRAQVDGIIAFDNSATVEAFGREHDRLAPNIPFVSMGAYWSEEQSFVGIDLRAGVETAMDYLVGTGRKRIAYLAPSGSDLFNEGVRLDVYRQKMEDAGLEPYKIGVPGPSPFMALPSLREQVKSGAPPEAILCLNDDYAIGAAFALESLGLRVGTDVVLVGFDGIQEIEHCPLPITTVKQPFEEMCALAIEFLDLQIRDPRAPLRQQMLKPQLVIREGRALTFSP